MNNNIIKKTEEWVKKYMESYDCSHNFKHVMRVKKLAIEIAESENLDDNDIFEVILAALTHDIADHKYTKDINEHHIILKDFFKDKLDTETINNIIYITTNTSLSKETSNTIIYKSLKLKCVQDADRIDSLGSIGIARYFIYGVIKNKSNMEEIIDNLETRTNVLLKYINTDYGKKKAEKKYEIIKAYIEDFRESI